MQVIIRQICRVTPQRFFPKRGSVNILLLLCVVLGVSACSSARVNQFKNFSQAGIAYSQVANLVLKEAGDTVIDESWTR